jgi:hypothetical protein
MQCCHELCTSLIMYGVAAAGWGKSKRAGCVYCVVQLRVWQWRTSAGGVRGAELAELKGDGPPSGMDETSVKVARWRIYCKLYKS